MKIVYAQDFSYKKEDRRSIFLAGPTPRKEGVESWRPAALDHLRDMRFDGVVFVPEGEDGKWRDNYMNQVEWEYKYLNECDRIAMWVPRELVNMPAFTTNVEFGMYVKSFRLLYGRPEGAPKTRYLDWIYKKETNRAPSESLRWLLSDTLTDMCQVFA